MLLLFWYSSKQDQLNLCVTLATVDQKHVLNCAVPDVKQTTICITVKIVIGVILVQIIVLLAMDIKSVRNAIRAITDLFAKVNVQAA